MPLKLIVTLLAYVHQIAVIERYFRNIDISTVKIDLVMYDITSALMTRLAQSAVNMRSFGNICTATAFPLLGSIKLSGKFFHTVHRLTQKPPMSDGFCAKEKHSYGGVILQRTDLNRQPSGYEPDELPIALLCHGVRHRRRRGKTSRRKALPCFRP